MIVSIKLTIVKKILKFINSIHLAGYDRSYIQWCALEKIHGTNFTILCDGINIEYARRNCKLTSNEVFYNYNSVIYKHVQNIIELFNLLKSKFEDIEYIQVHGEIFGGLYDHPNVPQVKEAIKIQQGIYYAPFNDYLIFDIMYITDDNKQYLSQFELIDFCTKTNLEYIPILHIGTFDEMINLNPEYDSTIYQRYGLPKIENNMAEEYVIKPIYPLIEIKQNKRIIIKLKADKFADKKTIKTTHKLSTNITEEQQQLIDTIMCYVTEAKISSAKSKYDYDNMKKSKLYGLIVKDILNDVQKEHTVDKDMKKIATPKIIKELINIMYE